MITAFAHFPFEVVSENLSIREETLSVFEVMDEEVMGVDFDGNVIDCEFVIFLLRDLFKTFNGQTFSALNGRVIAVYYSVDM